MSVTATIHNCATCPAFPRIPGEGRAGTCQAAPPVVFPDREFFRGSSRSLLFGTYPACGTFTLVSEDDFCMAHPENHGVWRPAGD
jgi:hypothetical protein